MKLGLAIRELHRSERKLALDLTSLASRHKTDHEIHHTASDLAVWSQDHVRELAVAPRLQSRLSKARSAVPTGVCEW